VSCSFGAPCAAPCAALRLAPALLTDGRDGAHGLACVELAHKHLVLDHGLHGVRKRDHDGEREALRHSHDDDGDADEQEGEDGDRGAVVVALRLDKVSDEQHEEDEGAAAHAEEADALGHLLELLLQRRGRRLARLKLRDDLADARARAHGEHQHGAGAGRDLRAGDEVSAALAVAAGRGLGHLEALAGHGALVALDAAAAQQQTVAGQHLAGLDDEDVAHDDVEDGDGLLAAVAHELHGAVRLHGREARELPLLQVVVDAADAAHNDDGHRDGAALDEVGRLLGDDCVRRKVEGAKRWEERGPGRGGPKGSGAGQRRGGGAAGQRNGGAAGRWGGKAAGSETEM
jgi:hypothetical protein